MDVFGDLRGTCSERVVIECVVNISEGTDTSTLESLASVCGNNLLDVHSDPDHNRSVFTLIGTEAPRRLAAAAVAALDLTTHSGVHPRLGVVDVVPFVALGEPAANAVAARDDFARWAADTLNLPCFLYGDQRTLPEVRKGAFSRFSPDHGPGTPHPSAGACAVGARDVLVAYNVWLPGGHLREAQAIARTIRQPGLRALGLKVGDRAQVSMNLVAPETLGPDQAYDAVEDAARAVGSRVEGAELVGLVPDAVLQIIDPARWEQLGLSPRATIEHRVAMTGGG